MSEVAAQTAIEAGPAAHDQPQEAEKDVTRDATQQATAAAAVAQSSSEPATSAPMAPEASAPVVLEPLRCPFCPESGPPVAAGGRSSDPNDATIQTSLISWISCGKCKEWMHAFCLSVEDADAFLRWYCPTCIEASHQAVQRWEENTARGEGTSQAKKPRPLENKLKPQLRRTERKRQAIDYAAIEQGLPPNPIERWTALLENSEQVKRDQYRRMHGEQWTMKWIEEDDSAFEEPVMVPSRARRKQEAEGKTESTEVPAPHAPQVQYRGPNPTPRQDLEPVPTSIPGMRVPPPDVTIWDIADILGHDMSIEVIDVASQRSSFNALGSTVAMTSWDLSKRSHQSWTLAAWASYFHTPPEQRKKVLNVISLEVSGTKMERFVQAPDLVSQLDWVTRDWPQDKRSSGLTMKGNEGNSWPKVQRYVLMGVAGAYTDFHCDFAASSVYYHVVFGQKTFLFAPPTKRNLAAYRKWSCSSEQDVDWLGNHVEKLTRVDVHAGDTLLIPSGWIHAVYTPVDTLVVGGNFLHDLGAMTQLRLVDIENESKVQRKAKFPHLKRLLWYVAAGWNQRLQRAKKGKLAHPIPPMRKVVPGLLRVLQALEEDIELIDDPHTSPAAASLHATASLKREVRLAKEAIPAELAVKDAREARKVLKSLRTLLEQQEKLLAPPKASVKKAKRKGEEEASIGAANSAEKKIKLDVEA